MKQHKKPCKECPFRRKSLAGYLGSNDLEEFTILAVSETKMPCHLTEGDGGMPDGEMHPNALQCAGRGIFLSNMCKSPRDKSVLTLPADRDTVFSRPQEFVEHHSEGTMKIVVDGSQWPFYLQNK
jgi:hypothetical protein